MFSSLDVTAYLNRIGLSEPIYIDREGLLRLQYSHLLRVPFENLDIHLGRPIQLDRSSLFQKIVVHRRGGFCYELNGLFAMLLNSLGFPVILLSARAAKREGGFGPDFDHLALLVDLEEPYLVDVGFGDAFLEPLRLLPDIEQRQRAKTFSLSQQGDVWLVRERKTGEAWKPLYLFTLVPRSMEDFIEMCRYHQHLTRKPFHPWDDLLDGNVHRAGDD